MAADVVLRDMGGRWRGRAARRSGGDVDEDDDYYDDDEVMMVMTLKNAEDCIGCEACSKVCPKNCQSFAPVSA